MLSTQQIADNIAIYDKLQAEGKGRKALELKWELEKDCINSFRTLVDENKALATQLAEAKADYEAAVEDMKIACTVGEPCFICKHGCNRGDQFPCSVSDDWCKGEKWTYRGRQGNG